MTVELRIGDVPDWGALHTLLKVCFAGMEGRIDPPSSLNDMGPDDLRAKAAAETLVTLWSDGSLVACGFLADTGTEIHLGKLAVLPAFRGQGLLRMIVGAAEDIARDRGRPALSLQSRIELTENHAAFAALGFREAGRYTHPGHERATSLVMRKAL